MVPSALRRCERLARQIEHRVKYAKLPIVQTPSGFGLSLPSPRPSVCRAARSKRARLTARPRTPNRLEEIKAMMQPTRAKDSCDSLLLLWRRSHGRQLFALAVATFIATAPALGSAQEPPP